MWIGIVGQRRTGKDTVAGFIRDRYPNLKHVSFAGPLKTDIIKALHASAAALGPVYDSFIRSALQDRDVMGPLWQWWGTELVRRQRPNYWIDRCERENGSQTDVILTDVRFRNEAEYIRSKSGMVIRIIGPQRIPPGDNRSDTHRSETELQHIIPDVTVINHQDYTLDDLRRKVYLSLIPQIEEHFKL